MSNNNRKSSKIAPENESDYKDEVTDLFTDKKHKLNVTSNDDVLLEMISNENNVALLELEINNKSGTRDSNAENLVSEDNNNFINNGTTIDSTSDRNLRLLSNISKGFNEDRMFINNQNTMNTNIDETGNLIINNQESIVDKTKLLEESTSSNNAGSDDSQFLTKNNNSDTELKNNETTNNLSEIVLEHRDLNNKEISIKTDNQILAENNCFEEIIDNENRTKDKSESRTTECVKGDSYQSETDGRNIGSRLFNAFMHVSLKGLKCLSKFHIFRGKNEPLSGETGKFTKSEKHPKPGGLRNSQSTCYMNAMIQALSSSDFLLKTLESLAKTHSNSSLLLLYNLLNAINEPNKNNENLMRNTNLLGDLIKSVGWTKPSQQDAFDLLAALICDIYKNSIRNDEMEIPLKIKLLHEFQGMDCPNAVQKYLGLSLHLSGNYKYRPGVPLQFLINNHFMSTTIDEDPSKLVRLSLYQEIPNILLIHIQANKWDPISRQMIKPIYYIQYDENMTLWFDIVNEMDGENRNLNEDRICSTEVQYHLKSIVDHVGNISGGHYVAHKMWRDEWYLANDESIIKSKKAIENKISPYIMIYERS